MTGLLERLKQLDTKIKVGIAGIGSIGRGLALQAQLTPGMECVAIADVILERAVSWAEYLKLDYRIVDNPEQMHDVIRQGKLAVCEDGEPVARCALVDVFIESTNSVADGGRLAITALRSNKHAIMMNYEADLMFGSYLMRLAEENGLVYTVCDGDQPAVIKRLVGEMEFMGFELVMAGNIKGFLDRYADPASIVPEADKRNLDYRMCTSYTDGSKLGVEMAVLANGLNLRVTVPGMMGPRMNRIIEVFDHFDFEALWEDRRPIADYVLGAVPKGGVFAVGFNDEKHQRDTFAWIPPEMGSGPFYLFHRPYHLAHMESMATVATAVLDGRSVLKPDFGFKANVYAHAKRDLAKGEVLDGIGGFTCYGMVENCPEDHEDLGLPICLADGVALVRDIRKDEKITTTDVSYDRDRFDFKLFAESLIASRETRR